MVVSAMCLNFSMVTYLRKHMHGGKLADENKEGMEFISLKVSYVSVKRRKGWDEYD